MKKYYVLTGELVEIIAENEEEVEEKLGNGEYEFIEALSEIQGYDEVEDVEG